MEKSTRVIVHHDDTPDSCVENTLEALQEIVPGLRFEALEGGDGFQDWKVWLTPELVPFSEREPEEGAYVSLVWEDGSDCECVYRGLDRSIEPLPTHWYYVKKNS